MFEELLSFSDIKTGDLDAQHINYHLYNFEDLVILRAHRLPPEAL